MVIHIRKLTGLDIEAYKSLRLLSLQTDPDAFFLQYSYAKNLPVTFFLQELFSKGDRFGFYGGFVDTKLVGMISVQPMMPGKVQLFTLYVRPEYRHKGFGKALLQYVLTSIIPRETVRLTVIAGNPAIALYASLGFVHMDTHKGALVNGRGSFDELVFQRGL